MDKSKLDKSKLILINFLKNIVISIENNEILPEQLRSVGEFFMDWQFQKQNMIDNDLNSSISNDFSQKEILKFVTLGWYIYNCILDEKRIPQN